MLNSPRTSPRVSVLGAEAPLTIGALLTMLVFDAALAACLRTSSAHDFGAGGGGEASAGSGCFTSSVVGVDSASDVGFDLVEVIESRCGFRKATGLTGIAGMIGTTGTTDRADFVCVGVCWDFAVEAIAEDGVVGCVDMASDCASEGIVVGVSMEFNARASVFVAFTSTTCDLSEVLCSIFTPSYSWTGSGGK